MILVSHRGGQSRAVPAGLSKLLGDILCVTVRIEIESATVSPWWEPGERPPHRRTYTESNHVIFYVTFDVICHVVFDAVFNVSLTSSSTSSWH